MDNHSKLAQINGNFDDYMSVLMAEEFGKIYYSKLNDARRIEMDADYRSFLSVARSKSAERFKTTSELVRQQFGRMASSLPQITLTSDSDARCARFAEASLGVRGNWSALPDVSRTCYSVGLDVTLVDVDGNTTTHDVDSSSGYVCSETFMQESVPNLPPTMKMKRRRGPLEVSTPLGEAASSYYNIPIIPSGILSVGVQPTSLDFHPEHNLLLVGNVIGEVMVFDVLKRTRLAVGVYEVWGSTHLHLTNDPPSVTRVMWSPSGQLCGVSYSNNLVQIFAYPGSNVLSRHREIAAHEGRVNDLAFVSLRNQLFIITCGDDRMIKGWHVTTGSLQYCFEGHKAAVCSVCPLFKDNELILFSAAIDGSIKSWQLDRMDCNADFDAPGLLIKSVACSFDGSRLFTSGRNEEGKPVLIQWIDGKPAVLHSYVGIENQFVGNIQYDASNKLIAVGDGHSVKFWDMDFPSLLTINTIEDHAELLFVRFNREGSLLAVATNASSIKIFADRNASRLFEKECDTSSTTVVLEGHGHVVGSSQNASARRLKSKSD